MRWVIISNRLPITYDKNLKKVIPGSGGLVTALSGVKADQKILWIGQIPEGVSSSDLKELNKKSPFLFDGPRINEKLYASYYNGFCNNVLWPLFHYETDRVHYQAKDFDSYREVNKLFADYIAKKIRPNDLVWIHDFHFLLLPKLLKKKCPQNQVGYFHHIPFPSSEVYRELPCRTELLEGVMGADLIGFHDYSYLRHFSSSIYRLMGLHGPSFINQSNQHLTRLGVYPVSIDTDHFKKLAVSKKTEKEVKKYGLDQKKRKIILGIDRLDYSKGLIEKLHIFELLLRKNPRLRGQIQLIQIAIPSRVEVNEYRELREKIEQLVGHINGLYGDINYVPVKYIFSSVSKYQLSALYRSSDLLLVTSKRDGMNLVCLEYLCSQSKDNPGEVLLSEFAGAASSLSHVTFINPHNEGDSALKCMQALSRKVKHRQKNHQVMMNYLEKYTATHWAESFMGDLNKMSSLPANLSIYPSEGERLIQKGQYLKYKNLFREQKITLFLDFDGTLAPIVSSPEKAKLSPEVREVLKKLSQKPNVEIIILSGRPRTFLEAALKGLKCHLAAEHGAWSKLIKEKKWRLRVNSKKNEWSSHAKEIIQNYVRRTPGSFLEQKTYALVWHYRSSVEEFANYQARNLLMDLESVLSSFPVKVSEGKKIIEVKALEANKGHFINWYMTERDDDKCIALALGDDLTDEDMFKALNEYPQSYTIKIGADVNSTAKYSLLDQTEVLPFLKALL